MQAPRSSYNTGLSRVYNNLRAQQEAAKNAKGKGFSRKTSQIPIVRDYDEYQSRRNPTQPAYIIPESSRSSVIHSDSFHVTPTGSNPGTPQVGGTQVGRATNTPMSIQNESSDLQSPKSSQMVLATERQGSNQNTRPVPNSNLVTNVPGENQSVAEKKREMQAIVHEQQKEHMYSNMMVPSSKTIKQHYMPHGPQPSIGYAESLEKMQKGSKIRKLVPLTVEDLENRVSALESASDVWIEKLGVVDTKISSMKDIKKMNPQQTIKFENLNHLYDSIQQTYRQQRRLRKKLLEKIQKMKEQPGYTPGPRFTNEIIDLTIDPPDLPPNIYQVGGINRDDLPKIDFKKFPKPEPKPEPKPDVKPDVKPEIKDEPMPDVEVDDFIDRKIKKAIQKEPTFKVEDYPEISDHPMADIPPERPQRRFDQKRVGDALANVAKMGKKIAAIERDEPDLKVSTPDATPPPVAGPEQPIRSDTPRPDRGDRGTNSGYTRSKTETDVLTGDATQPEPNDPMEEEAIQQEVVQAPTGEVGAIDKDSRRERRKGRKGKGKKVVKPEVVPGNNQPDEVSAVKNENDMEIEPPAPAQPVKTPTQQNPIQSAAIGGVAGSVKQPQDLQSSFALGSTTAGSAEQAAASAGQEQDELGYRAPPSNRGHFQRNIKELAHIEKVSPPTKKDKLGLGMGKSEGGWKGTPYKGPYDQKTFEQLLEQPFHKDLPYYNLSFWKGYKTSGGKISKKPGYFAHDAVRGEWTKIPQRQIPGVRRKGILEKYEEIARRLRNLEKQEKQNKKLPDASGSGSITN